MRDLSGSEALDQALLEEMRRDPRIVLLGAPGTLPEIAASLPARASWLTPISEAAVSGMAIGLAASGFRPVVHFGMITFAFVAMDQIVNQASKLRYMSGGQVDLPIVYRARIGAGTQSAAQHSQSPYSMFMHLAGLQVMAPSTPRDMYGLLKTALRGRNPVFSFEHQGLLTLTGDVPDADEDFTIPLGSADVKRRGEDVTVVAIGRMVHEALAAADRLAYDGIDVEVLDPRSLVPLDVVAIRQSVQRTTRLVVVDEAPPTASAAAEISATATEDPATFRALRAPVLRVCAATVPVPFSPPLERAVIPDADAIERAVREAVRAA